MTITRVKPGFTILETIIMIGVFTMAMLAVATFIRSAYTAYRFSLEQAVAINEARRGIETMVKEIRGAKIGDDGSYPLISAGDFQFVFYSDVDRDDATERIRYFLDGSDFKKGVVKPIGDPPQYILSNEQISILSRYVRNGSIAIFTYYNGNWPADIVNNPLPTLTRLTDTKLMHVYLKINVDLSRLPESFDLDSETQIRNLKTNL